MTKKILAGITEGGDLYVLNIETESPEHTYFAMSADASTPIKVEHAKQRVYDQLEDGEEWKYAVQDGQTEMSKSDWIQYVLDSDGELAGFDNSLFPDEVIVDGDEWIFESGSCGQHEVPELAHYFIPEEQFRALMSLWKQYHVKPEPKTGIARAVLDNALAIVQDRPVLAERAVWLYKEMNDA